MTQRNQMRRLLGRLHRCNASGRENIALGNFIRRDKRESLCPQTDVTGSSRLARHHWFSRHVDHARAAVFTDMR